MDSWIRTWKNIAAYLGVHPDTAKVWHKQRGMPVYEDPGGVKVALKELLDQWLIEANKIRKVERKRQIGSPRQP